ncbi:MAG: hypothetical protein NZM43_06900 [Saprospiraceae bacterium]|nr:hypothetical protein [Saprospiraceae bacterium]MDW8484037.1 hypothetical protein [Saprospiraceae bacterium]
MNATARRLIHVVERWLLLPGLIAGAIVGVACVQHDPFFWDTVQLGSKHAHFFYENGLHWAPLPREIDSGHPPTLGYYLAWVWSVFGRSLPVSHWAMLPFVVGTVILLFRLGTCIGGKRWEGAGLVLLAAADPVLATQSSLVGPDIVLSCFFLLAVWALWTTRLGWAAIGVAGLCVVSLRGMMVAVALLAWQVYLLQRREAFICRQLLEPAGKPAEVEHPTLPRRLCQWLGSFCPLIAVFAPGFALAGGFLLWHHQAVGWTGFHAASPWAPAFEPVRGTGLLRNVAILGWRWADFGRIFEWIGLIILFFALFKNRRALAGQPWLSLLSCTSLFLSPSAILYQNLSAHRYFLPIFLALHLFFWYCLKAVPCSEAKRLVLTGAVMIGLACGNLWIYPHGIAIGWDATLAHRPYHTLRAQALHFIEKNALPLAQIGTAFPNRNAGKHLLLNCDERMWAEFDPRTNKYCLISNVFNDVSPEDRTYLRQHKRLMWSAQKGGVWMELYGPK